MPERDELYAALAACLAALEAGASLEEALARYPTLAAELRPLLVAAQMAGADGNPARVPAIARVASRSQFLARATELGSPDRSASAGPGPRPRGWWRLRAWLRAHPLAGLTSGARGAIATIVIVAGLSAGTYGAVAASAASLPGDPLYGVKRTVESTELMLAPDDQARAQLQAEYDRRRVLEIRALATQHRQAPVDFTGALISMSGAQNQFWLVSAVSVLVGPQVPVEGEPVVGAQVHVRGVVQADGVVLAEQVSVLPHHAAPTEQTATPTTQTSTVTATTAPSATPAATETQPATSAPAVTATASPTREPVASPTPSATPELTRSETSPAPSSTVGPTDGGGLEKTQTAEPTEAGGGSGPTQTPQATEGGGNSEATQPAEPTEAGDHSSKSTPKLIDNTAATRQWCSAVVRPERARPT